MQNDAMLYLAPYIDGGMLLFFNKKSQAPARDADAMRGLCGPYASY